MCYNMLLFLHQIILVINGQQIQGLHVILHPIGNYFMIMFKLILDMFNWGDEPCKIVGKGKVRIKLNNGSEWLLKDVSHIPAMKRNLISTGQLGDSSCLSTFGETWWKITKGSLVIAKGDRVGASYLCPHNTDYSISVASTEIGTFLL